MPEPTMTDKAALLSQLTGVPISVEISDAGWRVIAHNSCIVADLPDRVLIDSTHHVVDAYLLGMFAGTNLSKLGGAVEMTQLLSDPEVQRQLRQQVQDMERGESIRRREMN